MPYPTEPPPPPQLQPPPPRPLATLQPQRRHRRTWYYAKRVQENLQTRVAKTVCSIFLSLLFIVALILFILWLSLRPHRPRFHVSSFSVPGISNNSTFQNSDITFDVSDRNPNGNIGIYYESMAGSLFYENQQIGGITGLLPDFYQPPKNTTIVHGVFAGSLLTVSDNVRANIANVAATGRPVTFWLQLSATIRFKVTSAAFGYDTHRHGMNVGCRVEVGPNGEVLPMSEERRCSIYFG